MADDTLRAALKRVVGEQVRLWWNDTMRKDWENLLAEWPTRDFVLTELIDALVAALAASATDEGPHLSAHDRAWFITQAEAATDDEQRLWLRPSEVLALARPAVPAPDVESTGPTSTAQLDWRDSR